MHVMPPLALPMLALQNKSLCSIVVVFFPREKWKMGILLIKYVPTVKQLGLVE